LLLPSEINQIELEDGDLITAFDYLMEKEALIIGTENGLLLLHNIDDNSTEIVGQVEGGVKCISPSPDGDLLAILTGFRQVLVMTHDWDLLYEIAVEEKENYGDGLDVRKGQPFSLVTLVCILVVWFKFILQNAIVLICV
jgi:elongator complex protein 1